MRWTHIKRLRFKLRFVEGGRVGGSGGELEIGGAVDANLTAIRNPGTKEFYIPGSSLKGKLRSSLEKALDKCRDGKPCGCGLIECEVCVLFGAHLNLGARSAPSRIVVRDCSLSEESRATFREAIRAGRPTYEEKTENIINRKGGQAEHPRTGERFLPETIFDGEILVHIYETDNADRLVKLVRRAMGLVQEGSSIGASGSRGYGKVRFENLTEETIDTNTVSV
jgi:CRISPR-associated protein Csm3